MSRGLGGLSAAVFTQMTPAPGSAGGLLNAIVGSAIITGLGVAIGTPIGLFAAPSVLSTAAIASQQLSVSSMTCC